MLLKALRRPVSITMNFFVELSEKLPAWKSIWIWPSGQKRYEFAQGKRIDSN
jgi:hypothetical protein